MTSLVRRPPRLNQGSTVPSLLRNLFVFMLVVSAVLSVPQIGSYGPIPITSLLDAWVIAVIVAIVLRGRIQSTVTILLLVGYLLTRLVPALITDSPMEDFSRAYRWVLYLLAFAIAIGQTWGPLRSLIKAMWALLVLAIVKAALTFVVMGAGSRSGLLIENNFELALFAGLVALLYRHLGRHRVLAVLLLGVLTILSGSRSGAVAFVVLALYALTQSKSASLLIRYLIACLVPVLVLLPLLVFAERAGNSTQIDRINFLNVFIGESRGWDALTWLIGTPPITPLRDGCIQLSYYENLFSSVGDGTCYSVILHAFILRLIFDAGIVGVLIAFGTSWFAMRRAGVTVGLTICLLAIALTNSLSVSGLNNPYVAIPILFAILTVTSELAETTDKDSPVSLPSELTSGGKLMS